MQTVNPHQQIEQFRNYLCEDPANRIILNLDIRRVSELIHIDKRVISRVGMVKIGHELNATASWLVGARALHSRKARGLFFDTRFSENPDQVKSSTQVISESLSSQVSGRYPKMLSVDVVKAESLGLQQAVSVRNNFMIIGETVQPSTSHDECVRKYRRSPADAVMEFSMIAAENGLQGVSCSPLEVAAVARYAQTSHLLRIATGIRELSDHRHDQLRVGTSRSAILSGADMISIGRTVLGLPYEQQYDKLEEIIESVDKAIGI